MEYSVQYVEFAKEFKICPACGYKDGFHSMFRQEDERVKWLFICPSCHQVYDLGFTVSSASGT